MIERSRRKGRGTFATATTIVVVALVGYWYWKTSGPNFHVVLPGQVYRASQPTAAQLARYQERYGIKTVVNLRGSEPGKGWYDAEYRTAEDLGLELVSVPVSNDRLASIEALQKLVEVFDAGTKPILLHGESGANETCLASAVMRVLAGDSVRQARQEYGLRYGNVGSVGGGYLPHLFDLYQKWLLEQGKPGSPESFRLWAKGLKSMHYFSTRISCDDPPDRIEIGRRWELRIRVENTSELPWPGDEYPMHLIIHVASETTSEKTAVDLPDEQLLPEGEWEALAQMDSFSEPGEYQIEVDLFDGRDIDFSSMGPFLWRHSIVAVKPRKSETDEIDE